MPAETYDISVQVGPPASASARRYLRRGLPGVYQDPPDGAAEDAFAMRFLLGLEEVLDPIVAMLDLLPAHLDLELAPPEIVALVARWLGVELDGGLTDDAHRRLVRHATELCRARGTRRGLELTLELAFGRVGLEVREDGGATWSGEPGSRSAAPATLTVVCPPSLTPAARAAVRRVVEEVRPAHVTVELGGPGGRST
jgi:phage tail-like protein